MGRHRVTSSLGREFEVVVGDDSRIAAVVGEWPAAGQDFVLHDPPAHMSLLKLPERLAADPRTATVTVCWYDEATRRTCFCDDARRVLHCVTLVRP